jgi:DNA mismatch repair protein MutL
MEVTKALVSFESENFDFKIKGHLTKPLVTRASKNHITIIVNGRAIRNYKIVNAVVDAYHTFMPKGRYPIGLIEINLDPYLIDVNVHPSKQEVRISKESDLVDLLKSTIKDRLNKKEHIPKVEIKRSKVFVEQPTLDLRVNKEKTYEQKPVYKEVRYDDRPKNDFKEEINILKDVEEQVATNSVIINEDRIVLPINKNEKVVNEQPIFKEEIIEEVLEEIDHVKEDVLDVVFDDPTETRFPELEVVGQIHGTYIITQNKDGMYLIDQHAAQERINYELYYKKLGNNQHEVIDLLIPHTIEFRNDEAMLVKENFDAIRSHGIDIDEFGNNAFIIRAHPIWFEEGKELEIVEEVIDTLLKKKLVSVSKLREEMAINMSCKRSIKANRFLTQDEMERLIHDLSTCAHPFSCPHGRPVLVHFSSYDLEKMFKRVM